MSTDDEFFEIRNRLFDRFVLLTDLWTQYNDLFRESPARLRLLNDHAPWFFGTVQRMYLQHVVLYISRLTDPARSQGRRNVSMASLLEDPRLDGLPDIKRSLSEQLEIATGMARPIRRHRNRVIAHEDHEVTFGHELLPDVKFDDIQRVIDSLVDIHRRYGVEILERDASYDIYPMGSTKLLLEALEATPTRRQRAMKEEAEDLRQLREDRGS